MKQSILITGGAGFIGSNFLRLASQLTDGQIVILDALTYAGNLANISDMLSSGHVQFIRGDICDRDLVRSIFIKYGTTHVVHFAAESHVDRSIMEAGRFIKTNIEGTHCLLETARAVWTDSNDRLFLHVSSDEVFGTLGLNDKPFTSESPYGPNNPYAATKAASDHLVRAWHKTYGIPVIISHCSNNYGPWQFPEKLIPLTILNALEGKELPVYGDGEQSRDWIHVEDHCRALLEIFKSGEIGQTYLVSAQDESTNLSIVHMICDVVDKALGQSIGTSRNLVKFVKDRPGHDRRYALDNSEICRKLNWRPSYRIGTSLESLVRWYVDHRTWADEIRSGEYMTYYEKQYGAR